MEITTNLRHTNLRSTFLTTTTLTNHRKPYFRPFTRPISTTLTNCINKPNKHLHTHHPIRLNVTNAIAIDTQTTTTSIDTDDTDDIESLFSNTSPETVDFRRANNKHSGASTISSGVRLENISKSYKGVTVLKDVSWEVKKGEKVGLVGVNGAGKTTQLRIISGAEEPDSGNVIKVKPGTN